MNSRLRDNHKQDTSATSKITSFWQKILGFSLLDGVFKPKVKFIGGKGSGKGMIMSRYLINFMLLMKAAAFPPSPLETVSTPRVIPEISGTSFFPK